MFVNLSNHASDNWPEEEKNAAKRYGDIIDVAFPSIPVDITSEQMDVLVDEYAEKLHALLSSDVEDDAVMIQGESVFAYRMVVRLKKDHIRALAAVTERKSHEETLPDGTVRKVSLFVFNGFREY